MKHLIFLPFGLMLSFIIVFGVTLGIDIYFPEPNTELSKINYRELKHADSIMVILKENQKTINSK